MGIYYAAVDNEAKKYFEAPKQFSNKFPGICHPMNPFGPMVVMMNALGGNYDIENDGHWDCYYDKGYANITEKVFSDYLEMFPFAKDHYEKED